MNIPLLVTIIVGAALAGFIVKYDKQIFRAAAGAGRGAYRKRRTIILAAVALAVIGGLLTAGYVAAHTTANEWEKDFMRECYRRYGGERARQGNYLPSNMDINLCHRQWSGQPWYTRAGLLKSAASSR